MLTRRAVLQATLAGTILTVLPQGAAARARARPPRRVPVRYVQIGQAHGVPPDLLFAVALQESQQLWSTPSARTLLPWPWTLNIAGRGARYPTRLACLATLEATLAGGQRLVDIGLMQVCWKFHAQRFARPAEALDPIANLHAGAQILAEHYRDTLAWPIAVARYHSKTAWRGEAYAAQVFARLRALHA